MFELRLSAALEVLHATIGRKACRVPESDGVLHAELVLKGADNHLFASLGCCCGLWNHDVESVRHVAGNQELIPVTIASAISRVTSLG